MNDIATEKNAESGTTLRNFMANRGAIIIKEMKPIGSTHGEYGSFLEVETIVLRVIRGTTQNDAHGVLLIIKSAGNESEEKVHLDFDEIEELINALQVIRHTSTELGRNKTDYTEVIYATKDNAKFGFYQSNSEQMGFVNIGYQGQMFHIVHNNIEIEKLLQLAVEHLRTKGAEIIA